MPEYKSTDKDILAKLGKLELTVENFEGNLKDLQQSVNTKNETFVTDEGKIKFLNDLYSDLALIIKKHMDENRFSAEFRDCFTSVLKDFRAIKFEVTASLLASTNYQHMLDNLSILNSYASPTNKQIELKQMLSELKLSDLTDLNTRLKDVLDEGDQLFYNASLHSKFREFLFKTTFDSLVTACNAHGADGHLFSDTLKDAIRDTWSFIEKNKPQTLVLDTTSIEQLIIYRGSTQDEVPVVGAHDDVVVAKVGSSVHGDTSDSEHGDASDSEHGDAFDSEHGDAFDSEHGDAFEPKYYNLHGDNTKKANDSGSAQSATSGLEKVDQHVSVTKAQQIEINKKAVLEPNFDSAYLKPQSSFFLLLSNLYDKYSSMKEGDLKVGFNKSINELIDSLYDDRKTNEEKLSLLASFQSEVESNIAPLERTFAGNVGRVVAVIAIALLVAITVAAVGAVIAFGAPFTLPAIIAAFPAFVFAFTVGTSAAALVGGLALGAGAGAAVVSSLGFFARAEAAPRGTSAAAMKFVEAARDEYAVPATPTN